MKSAARRLAEVMLEQYAHEGRFAVRPGNVVDISVLAEAFAELGCTVEPSHRFDEFFVVPKDAPDTDRPTSAES